MILPAGEVAVWWMALREPRAGFPSHWLAVLDPVERERARRFRFDRDRFQFIAAHVLTRSMLAHFSGARPDALVFRHEEGKRPELEGTSRLRFSLSHTRGLVACAVAGDDPVGLDAEARDRAAAGTAIANAYFSPEEALMCAEDEDTFIRLWTLKEAFLKATGEGLGRPLNSFSFRLDPICVDDGSGGGDWHFAQFRPTENHYVAIALRRAGLTEMVVHSQTIDWENLCPPHPTASDTDPAEVIL